jgi:hypothetical protein
MGDRRHVVLHYGEGKDVYLYTHWRGSSLPVTVQETLEKRMRWDDPPYLARMIFSEMIRDDVMSETGYGISPYYCESEYDDVELFLEEQTVKIGSVIWSYEDYLKQSFIS